MARRKQVVFNAAKTHSILIGSRNERRAFNRSNTTVPSIYIGYDKVSPITSITYFGVQVDQHLNWEEHLLTIIKKNYRGIGMLRLAKRCLPLETVQIMYRSLIESYFRCCCPVWGSANSTNLQRLQKWQNRTARIVVDSPYDAHSEQLRKELGWHTIKQMIHTETVKIVFKVLHNEAPKYLKELFHRLSDIQNRELRNSKADLHIPLLRTSSGQKSFAYKGVCIWNNLTCEKKQVDRSPPLKQNWKHEEINILIFLFFNFYCN